MNFRFYRNERLQRAGEFSRVFKEGRRFGSHGLSVWILRREQGLSRLGLAIPKAYGNAVQRNRLKRLLRESFRLNKSKLKGPADFVFSARRLTVATTLQSIEPVVLELWKKANLLASS